MKKLTILNDSSTAPKVSTISRCRRGNRHHGVTLVEILIVVVVIAIFAGLVAPSLETNVHDKLLAAGRILAADIDYTRHLAVTNSTKYKIEFDSTDNFYALTHTGSDTSLNQLPRNAFSHASGAAEEIRSYLADFPNSGAAVEIAAAYRASTSVDSFEFGPLGETTQTDETVVWLASGNGSKRQYLTVHIDPITGISSIGQFQASLP